MRVLAVSNIPFPYIVDFFNELGKRCDLTVIFLRRYSSNRDKTWVSEDVKNFKAVYLRGMEFGSENVLSFGILKWLKPNKFDIIYFDCYSRATSLLGILYLKLTRIPFTISADGGFINEKENIVVKRIKRFFLGSATYWLSSGKTTDDYLVHYGADRTNIYHFPFTSVRAKDILDKPLSKSEKERYKQTISPDYKVGQERTMLLSVGQFIPRKGFETLIKAAKELPENCDVYIVGGVPTKDYIELIKKLGVNNVHFVGFKSPNDLKAYYLAADVFVFPTNYDIWGLVINEAMAAGLPVITTDKCIAGLELVTDSENGYIVPNGNQTILAKKIIHLLNNEREAGKMADASLNKIRSYHVENMASIIGAHFHKLYEQHFLFINNKNTH